MLRDRSIMGEIFESNIIDKKKIKNEIERIKQEKTIISTGSKNFNKVIGGGFFSGKGYVIFGANRTGKTQICHQLSVQAFENSIKVVYLDTENTFRPERVQQFKPSLRSIARGKQPPTRRYAAIAHERPRFRPG